MPLEYVGPINDEPELVRPLSEEEQKESAWDKFDEFAHTVYSQAVKPFKRTIEHYNKESQASRELVRQSYKDPGILKTPLRIAAGTAGYVFSPITAASKGLIGEPIQEALETARVPKPAAKFIGEMGTAAGELAPPGGVVKSLMTRGKPGLKAAQEFAQVVPKKLPPLPKSSLPKAGPILRPQVKQELIDGITKGAVDSLRGQTDESQRIFKQIADKLALSQINAGDLPEILKRNNLSPKQFAEMYAETVSTGGRILGYHGRAAKELKFVFKGNDEALSILEDAFTKEMGTPSAIDKFFDGWGKIENKRRGLIVGQVATAMRNLWSQNGRITLGALDESIQGVARNIFGVEGKTSDITSGLNTLYAAIGRLSPVKRKKLFDVLDTNKAALHKARLLSQPVHEVELGKGLVYLVNTLNRGQEQIFRRVGFEAKLRTLLKRNGMDYNTIDPKHIPEDILNEAVDYGLEMSFASSPKSKASQEFIKSWTRYGGTLINPFPRFNFANALPFVYEHSPLGYLNAVKPSTLRKLASGDVDQFVKSASRATIGSLMLDSAMRIRQSKHAGEKWYELNIGENKDGSAKTVDTRAFAPFSTYLFLAESLTNPQNIKPSDFAQALIGLNRISGTGLVAIDWIRKESLEDFTAGIKKFAGQYIGSWSTPVRTFKDIYSAFDENEAVYRDHRDHPIVSPFMDNLPKLSQWLPEKPSATETGRPSRGEPVPIGPVKIPAGIFRQATGLSWRNKKMVNREIDRLNLSWNRIVPYTGIPKADRKLSKLMAPYVEKMAPELITNPSYRSLPEHMQTEMLAAMFSEARSAARKKLLSKDWKTAIEVGITRLNRNIEKEVRSRLEGINQ